MEGVGGKGQGKPGRGKPEAWTECSLSQARASFPVGEYDSICGDENHPTSAQDPREIQQTTAITPKVQIIMAPAPLFKQEWLLRRQSYTITESDHGAYYIRWHPPYFQYKPDPTDTDGKGVDQSGKPIQLRKKFDNVQELRVFFSCFSRKAEAAACMPGTEGKGRVQGALMPIRTQVPPAQHDAMTAASGPVVCGLIKIVQRARRGRQLAANLKIKFISAYLFSLGLDDQDPSQWDDSELSHLVVPEVEYPSDGEEEEGEEEEEEEKEDQRGGGGSATDMSHLVDPDPDYPSDSEEEEGEEEEEEEEEQQPPIDDTPRKKSRRLT